MRRVGSAIALALMLLLGGSPAHAGHQSGTCKGAFSGTTPVRCQFFLRGIPTAISINGTSSGTASVHIWLDAEVNQPPAPVQYSPALLDCSATASRSASCTKAASIGSYFDSTEQIWLVDCHAQGSAGTSGTFACISASGF